MSTYRTFISRLSASYGRRWIVAALCMGISTLLLLFVFSLKIPTLPTHAEDRYQVDGDLSEYLLAMDRLEQHQSPYLAGGWQSHVAYQYPVQFVVFFIGPISKLVGVKGIQFVLMAVNVFCYFGGVLLFAKLVGPLLDHRGRGRLLLFLSFALIELNFLGNLHLGNVASILIGLSMGTLWAFMKGKPLLAGVLAAVMILIKPYWVVLPLVMLASPTWLTCRPRVIRFAAGFFGLLMASFIGLSLILGPAFSLQVSLDYVRFVTQIDQHYNWQMIFQIYNQSIQAVTYRAFGFGLPAQIISTLIKLAMLALLGINLRRFWKARLNPETDPLPYLALAFMSYVVVGAALPELLELTFLAIIVAFLQVVGDPLSQRITLPTLLVILGPAYLINGFVPYLLIAVFLVIWAGQRFVSQYLKVRSSQYNTGSVPEAQEPPNVQLVPERPVGR